MENVRIAKQDLDLIHSERTVFGCQQSQKKQWIVMKMMKFIQMIVNHVSNVIKNTQELKSGILFVYLTNVQMTKSF